LIRSQAWLNWWGRPLRWMTSDKHISNDQWKPWHAHMNIQVSSNSLASTKRPWRHTHCVGMGELFEKCWITTQIITPLLIIKGGPFAKTIYAHLVVFMQFSRLFNSQYLFCFWLKYFKNTNTWWCYAMF
jgi:hypothetical protein